MEPVASTAPSIRGFDGPADLGELAPPAHPTVLSLGGLSRPVLRPCGISAAAGKSVGTVNKGTCCTCRTAQMAGSRAQGET